MAKHKKSKTKSNGSLRIKKTKKVNRLLQPKQKGAK